MRPIDRSVLTVLAALSVVALCHAARALTAEEVAIIVNESAEGSVAIGEHYAKLRNIPAENILKLKASKEEEISRDEFKSTIQKPVKEWLAGKTGIVALVATRGVPVKIKQDPSAVPAGEKKNALDGQNFAAVDSELMLARQAEDHAIDSAIQNPYLNKDEPLTTSHGVLAVCRLDHPTVEGAKRLAELAILAELLGPEGPSLLDTRHDKLDGGYKERDDDMRLVADAWKTLNLTFEHDTQEAVIDLSTRSPLLHYYGWYAGTQKPAGQVRFRTGAIAVHLHSFSAQVLRTNDKHWVGPLLSWGCTASYGTVYEPYTVGFPYEKVFWDRLAKGYTFAEAGMMANHLLSWQAIFVGDPLYRPYPSERESWRAAARTAIASRIAAWAGGEKPADLPEGVDAQLVAAASLILAPTVESITSKAKKSPEEALRTFTELSFTLRGMGLGQGMGKLADLFGGHLKKTLASIRAKLKEDPSDTRELEGALDDFEGTSIHADLKSLAESTAKDQVKLTETLLKQHASALKAKKTLEAWQAANRIARMKWSDKRDEGLKLRTEIEVATETKDLLKRDANAVLRNLRAEAEKHMNSGKFDRAIEVLAPAEKDFPTVDESKATLEMLASARTKLREKEDKKRK